MGRGLCADRDCVVAGGAGSFGCACWHMKTAPAGGADLLALLAPASVQLPCDAAGGGRVAGLAGRGGAHCAAWSVSCAVLPAAHLSGRGGWQLAAGCAKQCAFQGVVVTLSPPLPRPCAACVPALQYSTSVQDIQKVNPTLKNVTTLQ